MVIKGGYIAWAQMGDPNASIPTPEPVVMRPQFLGRSALAAAKNSLVFCSQVSVDKVKEYGLYKGIHPVKKCRGVKKTDMMLNSALPKIKVDPETYQVTADGVLLTCAPLNELPLAQTFFLF
jgi:urease subunit alpha